MWLGSRTAALPVARGPVRDEQLAIAMHVTKTHCVRSESAEFNCTPSRIFERESDRNHLKRG